MANFLKKRFLLFSVSTAILLLAFNNCGRAGFDAEKNFGISGGNFASSECSAILVDAYAQTYFPSLSTSCNNCHSGAHGSTDLMTSYTSFASKGAALINYKATNPHGGNNINLQNQISSITPAWNKSQDDYTACLSRQPTPGSGGGMAVVLLNGKIIPMINTTLTNQNTWRPVSWDLETEVPAAQVGKFPAIFTIEARYYLYTGIAQGLEFRNPRLRMKRTGLEIQLSGLALSINNTSMPQVTTYNNVSMAVTGTTDVMLAPSFATALAITPVNDNSPVAFSFSQLSIIDLTTVTSTTTTTMPAGVAVVTLAQLLSTDSTLGVFNQSCTGCHSASNAAGGLNLTNSTQAISKASQILARMTNSGSPMPPSGLLNATKIKVVEDWIAGGAKP